MSKADPVSTAQTGQQSGVMDLFGQIQQLRIELAEIFKPMEGESHAFANINGRLDGILESTEHSCDGILEAIETILEHAATIRKESPKSRKIGAACDVIEQSASTAMENCAFQDLTSQRVTKIARDLMLVENRVHKITDIWGREDIQALAGQLKSGTPDAETDGENPAMHGPQSEGAAFDQEDIDALFK